jgi:hypothetical protein
MECSVSGTVDIASADPDRLQATVAIIGAGANGTLSALHLLRTSNDPDLLSPCSSPTACRSLRTSSAQRA